MMFEFSIDGIAFEWNGAHTVNVFFDPTDERAGGEGYNFHIFSLNYARDDYTPQEVMAHAYDWMMTDV
jgi:hypothetical protein